MSTRILQIIPAPVRVAALFESGKFDEDGRIIAESRPISCLALTQDSDSSENEVRAVGILPNTGVFEFVEQMPGFLGLAND